jgi:hypothetical protein
MKCSWNGRQPVHLVVVGEALVVVGHQALRRRRAQFLEHPEPDVPVQEQEAAAGVRPREDRQGLDQPHLPDRRRDAPELRRLAHAVVEPPHRQDLHQRHQQDLGPADQAHRFAHTAPPFA